MVRAGKATSLILAVVAILSAPLVAGAPDGLYQLLQQLNGIFFIPIASIMLAGLFIPQISAMGAKAGLFVGLAFYLLTTFIVPVNIHFVHIWGIEFLLNLAVMFGVSAFFPNTKTFVPLDSGALDLHQWKYTKPFSIVLVVVSIGIYVWLGW
jgi:SSS family solute:Na+ symporter